MSNELPEGWVSAKIGAVVEFRYGKGLPEATRKAGNVRVYGSNGVVGAHNQGLTNGPTIIVGRKGSVGAVHFCDNPCWPIDTTYFIDNFGPFDAGFLAHQLRAVDLSQQESSTAIPGLSRDDAYDRETVIPPLAEQRRIVEKVETLLEQVNRAKARLDRVPLILKRFRQAVLAAACSGELTQEWRSTRGRGDDEWMTTTIEQVSQAVVDCPHSTPKWAEEGEVCLRTTNFFVRGLDLREVRRVSRETYRRRVARLVPAVGDVVYSREGGILGIACVIPAGLRACLGQRMMLMRPNPATIRSNYLCAVLNSPATNATVRELTGGTASPHLNVGDIKRFEVPVPPLDEQDEIIRRLASLLTIADTIDRRVEVATTRTEKLPETILSSALSGELVPREAELARQGGRDYEPASLLLERVAQQRIVATPARRKPRAGKGTKPASRAAFPDS